MADTASSSSLPPSSTAVAASSGGGGGGGSSSYFDTKVAIVTGSGDGIGRAIGEKLLALGATVVFNSRSESSVRVAAALDADGERAVGIQADVSTDAGCRDLVSKTIDRFGHLDILVNNAGKNHPVKHTDLEGVTEEALRGVFEINTFGVFYMCRAAMPHLQASGDGSIVNVTSVAGIRPGGSSMPYSMSKAATNHLTLMLAKSFGPDVRINSVAPGLTDTAMMADPKHDAKKVRLAELGNVLRFCLNEACLWTRQ